MSTRDQNKYIEALRRYEKKMEFKEQSMFKMFLKRHKDDEDLDKLSMANLKNLYEKYHLNRDRKNFDHYFKKDQDSE
ncbi:MAG: hypothetical protein KKB34_13205 [Bacteroidetes bacterium]|nr:hypothetical protein [Bacteroidota bacterium]